MSKSKAWVMMFKPNEEKTECNLELYPLVLCKDCKYYKPNGLFECILHGACQPKPDWYCADGAPKEGR